MEKPFPAERLRVGKYGLLYAHYEKLLNKLNLDRSEDIEGGLHEAYTFSSEQIAAIAHNLTGSLIEVPELVTLTAEDRQYNYGAYTRYHYNDPEYGALTGRGARYNPWGDKIYNLNLYHGDSVTQYKLAVWYGALEETTIHKSIMSSVEATFDEMLPGDQADLLFEHADEDEVHEIVTAMLNPQIDPLEDIVRNSQVSSAEYAELIELIKLLRTTV